MSVASRDHPALVAAARHRLPGVPEPTTPPVIVDGDELDAIRMFCRTDRISGLLAGAVNDGEIAIAPDDRDRRSDRGGQRRLARRAARMRTRRGTPRASADRLDDVGVRWRVTKGSAVANLDFPDPALRTFADVDLMIHPDDWDAALELLVTDRADRSRALDFAKHYGKGCTTMVDDMEVDLHLRFAVGRFGARCRPEELFDAVDTYVLAGRTIPALTTHFRLLHACYHACLGGNAELRAFRDVAQLALGSPDAIDAAWDIARSWNVEAVVAQAVTETWRRLQLPSDHPIAKRRDEST